MPPTPGEAHIRQAALDLLREHIPQLTPQLAIDDHGTAQFRFHLISPANTIGELVLAVTAAAGGEELARYTLALTARRVPTSRPTPESTTPVPTMCDVCGIEPMTVFGNGLNYCDPCALQENEEGTGVVAAEAEWISGTWGDVRIGNITRGEDGNEWEVMALNSASAEIIFATVQHGEKIFNFAPAKAQPVTYRRSTPRESESPAEADRPSDGRICLD